MKVEVCKWGEGWSEEAWDGGDGGKRGLCVGAYMIGMVREGEDCNGKSI